VPRDARESFHDVVEQELNRERAATLGRAGRKIEDALAECAQAGARLAAASPDHRAAAVDGYRSAFRRYQDARTALCIYREALGLNDHRRVDEIYRPPPPPPPRAKPS
jgi:hypothetical protein